MFFLGLIEENILTGATVNVIRFVYIFISTLIRLKKKTTHYVTQRITNLKSTLTVRCLYEYFIEEHLKLSSKVKYEFYLDYFKDNYNFRFGWHQVDICGQCEELGTKLKSKTLNDGAKEVAAAERIVHKRWGEQF